jgi:hydrogenase expression/formation protein HypE
MKNHFQDAARLETTVGSLAISTDSFVVTPRFFAGGDIGKLAICGTVNDLAVSGAEPRWLTLGLILEEGFSMQELEQILQSIQIASQECNVQIVAGDTKVVPQRVVDGLFINTSGVGVMLEPHPPGPAALTVGDALIVSGPIGQHGVAILSARQSLCLTPEPVSDCGSLFPSVQAIRTAGVMPRCMRDATRGGLAAVLHEWSLACRFSLRVHESLLPITPTVHGVCELLGLDPLHLANEGTMLIAVNMEDVPATIEALHSVTISSQACVIGEVVPRDVVPVLIKRALGRTQPLLDPLGAPQPRIC